MLAARDSCLWTAGRDPSVGPSPSPLLYSKMWRELQNRLSKIMRSCLTFPGDPECLCFSFIYKTEDLPPPLSLENYKNVLWIGRCSETLILSFFLFRAFSSSTGCHGGCGQSGVGRGRGSKLRCKAVVPGTLGKVAESSPRLLSVCICPGPWQTWILSMVIAGDR